MRRSSPRSWRPRPPRRTQTRPLTGTAASDDGGDDNTRLEWFIGTGSVGTGGEFTGTAEEGDSIRCEATANDGLEDGTSLDVTVTIGA